MGVRNIKIFTGEHKLRSCWKQKRFRTQTEISFI